MYNFFKITFVLLFCNLCFGSIYTVKIDGTGDFTTIQTAVDEVVIGDSIMVYPGTYYENIIINGKDVMVKSIAGAAETIIDGNQNGTVITFQNGVTRAGVLWGFTITNGTGTYSIGSMTNYGGGVVIYDSSPTIKNCIIEKNHILNNGSAGGMVIKENSNPYLSGTTIRYNSAGKIAGGLLIGSPFLTGMIGVTMDSVNLCNIYLNYAGNHNDIYRSTTLSDLSPVNFYLDTFTVIDPFTGSPENEYFLQLYETDTFSIQNGYLEQINQDLYVSPTGSDTNSGLSLDQPLQSINYALALIKSDSSHPNTIHLDEGIYSPALNNQLFSLNLKSYVSLIGAGKELTILDGNNQSSILRARDFERDYKISDLSIINSFDYYNSALCIFENTNLRLENLKFSNNFPSAISCLTGDMESANPDSSSLFMNNLEVVNNSGAIAIYLGLHRWTLLKNSVVRETIPNIQSTTTGVAGGVLFNYHWLDYPFEIFHKMLNTEITKNINHLSYWGNGYSGLIFTEDVNVAIINCTIADNFSYTGGAVKFSNWLSKVWVINSIIYGNQPTQIFFEDYANFDELNTLVVANSIIQGGEEGIIGVESNNIYWLDGNFDMYPQFSDSAGNDYTLTENSPAIDQGIDIFTWFGDTIMALSPSDYFGDAPDIGAYEWYPEILGDVNFDDSLNILDIVIIVNMILEIITPMNEADANQDGDINILDIMYLTNLILT